MPDDLDNLRAALAAMTDAELDALCHAAENAPHTALGLMAFLGHACDWEQGRRHGRAFLLNGPHAAIPPEEMGVSFATLAALLTHFRSNPRVSELLGAVGDALDAEPPAVH